MGALSEFHTNDNEVMGRCSEMNCLVVVQAVGHLLLHMKSMAKWFSQWEERDLLALLRQASRDWMS